MSEQDFSQRLILVIRNDIEPWQVANTIAHISAYIGNKLGATFGTGDNFQTCDNVMYPRNSQYPIIIKRASSHEQLKNFSEKVRASGLLFHVFIREMIDHTNDADLQEVLGQKLDSDVELLGVGVFGPNNQVTVLSKKFGLWA
ncbi:MAG TPA: DUF2000 domain-containing protein [Candidatus Paceibacterota bacterium]|nr:DUF2000 domain-containing protein [Candidatus Paceibacterota bacterium]